MIRMSRSVYGISVYISNAFNDECGQASHPCCAQAAKAGEIRSNIKESF